MKRKTYNNVMKAIKLIQKKGYSFNEASEIVLKCFDNAEANPNGCSVEYYLDKIVTKEEWSQCKI